MSSMIKFAKGAVRFVVPVILTAALIFPLYALGQVETIDATGRGTSTQMGNSVKVIISQFSTPNLGRGHKG